MNNNPNTQNSQIIENGLKHVFPNECAHERHYAGGIRTRYGRTGVLSLNHGECMWWNFELGIGGGLWALAKYHLWGDHQRYPLSPDEAASVRQLLAEWGDSPPPTLTPTEPAKTFTPKSKLPTLKYLQKNHDSLPYADKHPYAQSKGFARAACEVLGIRQMDNMLIYPGQNLDGDIVTYQLILRGYDGKFTKFFAPGSKMAQGAFVDIPGQQADGELTLVEGLSTGLAHVALTGGGCRSCFDLGSMLKVGAAALAADPTLRLNVLADNDRWGKPDPQKLNRWRKGLPMGNPGLARVWQAWGDNPRVSITWPRFDDQWASHKPTDVWDYGVMMGPDAPKLALMGQRDYDLEETAWVGRQLGGTVHTQAGGYTDDDIPLLEGEVLGLVGDMGTGKTEFIHKKCAELRAATPGITIMIVTHRRSLATTYADRFADLGAVNYLDKPAAGANLLVISIQSLANDRLVPPAADVVIMDEAVSIVAAWQESVCFNRRESRCFRALKRLLGTASRVILADANFGARDLDAFNELTQGRFTPRVHINYHKPMAGTTYRQMVSRGAAIRDLVDFVGRGGTAFYACDSKRWGQAIQALLQEQAPQSRHLWIDAENFNETLPLVGDGGFRNYDTLGYSPSLFTAISLDDDKVHPHFHRGYVISCGVVTADDLIQGTRRYRPVVPLVGYVPERGQFASNVGADDLRQEALLGEAADILHAANAQGGGMTALESLTLAESKWDELGQVIVDERAKRLNDLQHLRTQFFEHLRYRGVTVVFDNCTNETDMRDIRRAQRVQRAQNLLGAEPIDRLTASRLRGDVRVTEPELWSLRQFDYVDQSGLPLTLDDVLWEGEGSRRREGSNWTSALAPREAVGHLRDEDEAVDRPVPNRAREAHGRYTVRRIMSDGFGVIFTETGYIADYSAEYSKLSVLGNTGLMTWLHDNMAEINAAQVPGLARLRHRDFIFPAHPYKPPLIFEKLCNLMRHHGFRSRSLGYPDLTDDEKSQFAEIRDQAGWVWRPGLSDGEGSTDIEGPATPSPRYRMHTRQWIRSDRQQVIDARQLEIALPRWNRLVSEARRQASATDNGPVVTLDRPAHLIHQAFPAHEGPSLEALFGGDDIEVSPPP